MVTYGAWQEGLVHTETLRFGSYPRTGAIAPRTVHSEYPTADSGLRSFRDVAVTPVLQGKTGATVQFPPSIPIPTQAQIDDASDQAYQMQYMGESGVYTYPVSPAGAPGPWANYEGAGAQLIWAGSGMMVGYTTIAELDGLAWLKELQKVNIAPSVWPAGAVGIEYQVGYEAEFLDATARGWTGTPEEWKGPNPPTTWPAGSIFDWTCYRKNPGSGVHTTTTPGGETVWAEDYRTTLTLATARGGQNAYDYHLGSWAREANDPITQELNALKVPRLGIDPATLQPIGVEWDPARMAWVRTDDPSTVVQPDYRNPANRIEWTFAPGSDSITPRDINQQPYTKRLRETQITVDIQWRSAPYRWIFATTPTLAHNRVVQRGNDGLGASGGQRVVQNTTMQSTNRRGTAVR